MLLSQLCRLGFVQTDEIPALQRHEIVLLSILDIGFKECYELAALCCNGCYPLLAVFFSLSPADHVGFQFNQRVLVQ